MADTSNGAAVSYTAQSRAAEEQEQARKNIGIDHVIGKDSTGIYVE